MDDDKPFNEIYAKLKDIVNSAFNFGEQVLGPKIIIKIVRSLLERFHAKITIIEESKDIDTIPLIGLIGNLQTYELGLVRVGKGNKSKNMENDKDHKKSRFSQFKSQDKVKKEFKGAGHDSSVPAGPKCYGCQEYGHMKQECLK